MIIYVDSPFQLLQCYELVEENSNKYKIYIRLNGNRENDFQLRELVSKLNIDEVNFLNINNIWGKIYYYTFLSLKSTFIKEIVIGDSNSILFKFLSIINKKDKFLLLDDGTATLFQFDENKKFKRFSIFPDIIDDCIENDFRHIKSFLATVKKIECGKHLIIGGKLSEVDICSEEVYAESIRIMIRNTGANLEDILYVAHRGECDKKLNNIESDLGIKVIRPSLPVELFEYEFKYNIMSVSTIISTAIFSMKIINPNILCKVLQLDAEDVKKRKEAILNLYRTFNNTEFIEFIEFIE